MKVLLAVDGSETSMEAAVFFCRLPHRETMDVSVLTVIGLPDVPLTASTDLWFSKFVDYEKESGGETFSKVEELFKGANAKLTHVSKQGHVGHSILVTAEEVGAELIVLGSKGCSNLERILLGSVSDFVASHAPMSVLVVRKQDRDQTKTESKLTLAVAYDDSTYSKSAIDHIMKFPWVHNAEVDLISVIPMHRVYQYGLLPAAFDKDDEIIRQVREATEKAAAELQQQKVLSKVNVVTAEHVGEKIVALTDASKPDLIVLGSRGRSGIARALLGSVSQYVLRHSSRSIWIVRNK